MFELPSPKVIFKIYKVAANTAGGGVRQDRLQEYILVDTHNDFSRQDEAEQWINESEDRYTIYTMMKVFKMP